jgi:hypothetical protein
LKRGTFDEQARLVKVKGLLRLLFFINEGSNFSSEIPNTYETDESGMKLDRERDRLRKKNISKKYLRQPTQQSLSSIRFCLIHKYKLVLVTPTDFGD